MTTFFDFAPSSSTPFQFQPTLDGDVYTAIVTWSLFRRGYVVNVYGLDGTLVAAVPLTGSPVGVALQSLCWKAGLAKAVAAVPHGLPIGATVALTVSGASPIAYNGRVEALAITRYAFSWPIAADPGTATVLGAISQDQNLVGGYFAESTLVYRTANAQFEVSP